MRSWSYWVESWLGDRLSMALQSFVGPWPLFSFLILYAQPVGLLGRGISQSQGRYLHTEQHKQNKRTQTFTPWVGFESTITAFERAKPAHALKRAATMIAGRQTIRLLKYFRQSHQANERLRSYRKTSYIIWQMQFSTKSHTEKRHTFSDKCSFRLSHLKSRKRKETWCHPKPHYTHTPTLRCITWSSRPTNGDKQYALGVRTGARTSQPQACLKSYLSVSPPYW
jgi:hypothetical protein